MAARFFLRTKFITSSDFLKAGPCAQAVYVQMCAFADKEGAVADVDDVLLNMGGYHEKNVEELADLGLIIKSDGVWFIRHWWVHNKIGSNDFLPDTKFPEERSKLRIMSDGTYGKWVTD